MELSWQAAADRLGKGHRSKNAKSRLCQLGSASVGGGEAPARLSVDASSRVGQRNVRGDALGGGGGDAAEMPTTEHDTARRRRRTASLRDLAPADKKRVANLIQELARLGQEKERITVELQSEREQFERTKQQLAGEQQRLLAERQSVQLELAQCQAMLLRFQQEVVNKLERAATASSAAPVASTVGGRTAPGIERPSSVGHTNDDYLASAPAYSSSALGEASPPPSSIASDDGTSNSRAGRSRTFKASESSGAHESSGYLSRTLDDYIDHFDRVHDCSGAVGSRSGSLLRQRPGLPSSAVPPSVVVARRQPDETRVRKQPQSSVPTDTSASCHDYRAVAAAAAPHVMLSSDAAVAAAGRLAIERSHFPTKVVRASVERESRTARVAAATGYTDVASGLPPSPEPHRSAGWHGGDEYSHGLYRHGRRFYGEAEEADDSAVAVSDHSRSLVTDDSTRWPHRVVAEPCEHHPSVAYVSDAADVSTHMRTLRCTSTSGAGGATKAQLYTAADLHSAAQHAGGGLHSGYSREFPDRRSEEQQPLYLNVAEPRVICSHGFCGCAHSGYFVGADQHRSYPAPEFEHHRPRGTQVTARRSPSNPSGLLSTSMHRDQQQQRPSYVRCVELPASSAEANRSCSRGASFVHHEPLPLEAEHRSSLPTMSLKGDIAGQLRRLSAKPEEEEPGQSIADDADITESRLLEDVFFVK